MHIDESAHGRYTWWEDPEPDSEYILGMDASEGRSADSDHTCIAVYRRELSRLPQVAEWYGRIKQGEGGELAYKIGQYYNWSLINCERNLSGAVEYALRKYGYPEERLFQPAANHSQDQRPGNTFFWWSDAASKRKMIDLMGLYLAGKVKMLGIRSRPTLDELDALQKRDDGTPETGGKDRVMATGMVVVADAFTPETRLPQLRERAPEIRERQPGRSRGVRWLREQEDALAEADFGVPEFSEF